LLLLPKQAWQHCPLFLIAFIAAKIVPAFAAAAACLLRVILCVGFVAVTGCRFIGRMLVVGPVVCFILGVCAVLLLVVQVGYILFYFAFHMSVVWVKAILLVPFFGAGIMPLIANNGIIPKCIAALKKRERCL
jgi:hypothetical protein